MKIFFTRGVTVWDAPHYYTHFYGKNSRYKADTKQQKEVKDALGLKCITAVKFYKAFDFDCLFLQGVRSGGIRFCLSLFFDRRI